jgi:hypothetical protein
VHRGPVVTFAFLIKLFAFANAELSFGSLTCIGAQLVSCGTGTSRVLLPPSTSKVEEVIPAYHCTSLLDPAILGSSLSANPRYPELQNYTKCALLFLESQLAAH